MKTQIDALVPCSSTHHLGYLLSRQTGIPLLPLSMQYHPDGELSVHLQSSVERKRVVLLGSFCRPIHTNIIEFTLLRDALVRNGVRDVIGMVSYMAYSRQDRAEPGKPVSIAVLADIVAGTGISSLHLLELHNPTTSKLFQVPVIHVSALPLLIQYVKSLAETLANPVVVSPDLGRWEWAQHIGRELSLPAYRMLKHRLSDRDVTTVCENDLQHLDVIFVDDIISTGVSLARATKVALDGGANSVHCIAVHGVFSECAENRLLTAGVQTIAVTNSIVTGFSQIDITPVLIHSLERHCSELKAE